jgi:hypothetical protein
VNEDTFKYDAAFSFLLQDEALAVRLNDSLKRHWRTFIYAEHQKELIGRDGETAFNDVFERESRLVVVLYRAGWGETRWTRIEETAIRNRGHEEGYDFTFFLALDAPPTAPKWLPRNRLWGDLARFGVPGMAAAIDSRLQEAGGVPHQETLLEKADRLAREAEDDRERAAFIEREGLAAPEREVRACLDAIQGHAETCGLKLLRDEQGHRWGILRTGAFSMSLIWQPPEFVNTIQDGLLELTLRDTFRKPAAYRPTERKIRAWTYSFDVTPRTHEAIWRPRQGDDPPLSTAKLAEESVHRLLDHVEKTRRQPPR